MPGPDTEVCPQLVTARAAVGAERARLWERWRELDAKLDAYAALRPSETAVVILERQPETADRQH